MVVESNVDVIVDASIHKSKLVLFARGESGFSIGSLSASNASTVNKDSLRGWWSQWPSCKNGEYRSIEPISQRQHTQVDVVIGS